MGAKGRISTKAFLVDSSGNPISSHLNSDGDYHLGTSIVQSVFADATNSSTTNLASGATFTGTSTSTLGVVGLQISLNTTENCTVYCDQSPDGTNWDVTDSYEYLPAIGNFGVTVQAVNSYVRVRVTNTGADTTTHFRLQLAMCPIVEALPRSLSTDQRLKSESTLCGRENTSRHAWITTTNALSVTENTRIAGTNFDGAVKDTAFWTETVTGTGAVAQSGEILLTTGTTANSTAKYKSVRSARWVVGSENRFLAAARFLTAGTADNIRRIGMYDVNNGFFFQLDGTTFSVGSRKSTTDTLVSSGSFNGNIGDSYVINTAYHKLEIEIMPVAAYFYIDGRLLHTISGHASDMLTLPITIENNNDNDSVAPVTFEVVATAVARQGKLATSPSSKYQTGQTAGLILKYGAGTTHGLAISGVVNNSVIILYDNTAASGTVLWSTGTMGAQTQPFYIQLVAPFYIGLTLAITGAASNVTVQYE